MTLSVGLPRHAVKHIEQLHTAWDAAQRPNQPLQAAARRGMLHDRAQHKFISKPGMALRALQPLLLYGQNIASLHGDS